MSSWHRKQKVTGRQAEAAARNRAIKAAILADAHAENDRRNAEAMVETIRLFNAADSPLVRQMKALVAA